jgi:hypothetical protein
MARKAMKNHALQNHPDNQKKLHGLLNNKYDHLNSVINNNPGGSSMSESLSRFEAPKEN